MGVGAAYERSRAASPLEAEAPSLAAIDASQAIAAVAEQPQLSVALSKAAIMAVAALTEGELVVGSAGVVGERL